MNPRPSSPALVDPAAAAALHSQAWVAVHGPLFQAALPHCEILRPFMAQVLDAMNANLGLQTLTSCRTQGLPYKPGSPRHEPALGAHAPHLEPTPTALRCCGVAAGRAAPRNSRAWVRRDGRNTSLKLPKRTFASPG